MQIDIRHIVRMGTLPCLCFIIAMAATMPATAGAASAPQSDISGLATRLVDTDSSVRTSAAFELRTYGQAVLPSLMAIYAHGTTLERRGAMIGLSLLPQPALGMPILLDGLGDMDMTTRSLAAHGLALLGTQAAPWLTARLSAPQLDIRGAAAFALKLMGRASIPALTQGLKSNDIFTRSKAAWLLGRMGHDAKSALPALIRALETDDMRVMHVVAEAIDLIGPDPELTVFHLLQLGSSGNACPTGRLGKHAAPMLVRLLTRPGTPLAQLAFKTLSLIGSPAVPALRQTIRAGAPGQKIAAALLLVEIDPKAVHTLPEDVRAALAGARHQPKK